MTAALTIMGTMLALGLIVGGITEWIGAPTWVAAVAAAMLAAPVLMTLLMWV